MRKKTKSTKQIVINFMEQSPVYGMFVVEAITRLAKEVAEKKADYIAQDKKEPHSFISPLLWLQVAEKWNNRGDENSTAK